MGEPQRSEASGSEPARRAGGSKRARVACALLPVCLASLATACGSGCGGGGAGYREGGGGGADGGGADAAPLQPFAGPCTVEHDQAADDVIDEREVYSYDDHGNQILREVDSPLGGPIDKRVTSTYDRADRVIEVIGDDDGDGTADRR